VERAAGGVLSRTGLAWAPGVERAGRASPPLRRPPSTVAASLALGAPLTLSFSLSLFLCVGLARGPLPLSRGPSCAAAERRCLPVSPSPLCRDLSRYQWAVSKRDREGEIRRCLARGEQRNKERKREREGQRKREVRWKRGPLSFPFPDLVSRTRRPHRDMTRESSASLWFQGPKGFAETSTKARKWF